MHRMDAIITGQLRVMVISPDEDENVTEFGTPPSRPSVADHCFRPRAQAQAGLLRCPFGAGSRIRSRQQVGARLWDLLPYVPIAWRHLVGVGGGVRSGRHAQ